MMDNFVQKALIVRSATYMAKNGHVYYRYSAESRAAIDAVLEALGTIVIDGAVYPPSMEEDLEAANVLLKGIGIDVTKDYERWCRR